MLVMSAVLRDAVIQKGEVWEVKDGTSVWKAARRKITDGDLSLLDINITLDDRAQEILVQVLHIDRCDNYDNIVVQRSTHGGNLVYTYHIRYYRKYHNAKVTLAGFYSLTV